ncbi:MAG: adenylate/guanylate cyclase domain-containing protein, partial [Candidatus Delongbacteria bacterium]
MMNDAPTIRKLRAIMFSDIVGYSKMMQNNESEALKLLQKHKDIVSEIAEKHGGKVIKYVGDEILVESESAVMLVYCAKELQKFFSDRNATVPKSRELWVRIGIHIGDVVMKEDDIFGDGVNIASRIRPIADPGGIVITHSVLILLGNQDDIRCNLIGNKKLKNIKERIKIYEVLLDNRSTPSLGLERSEGITRETFYKLILPLSMSVMFLFFLLFLIFRTNYSDYEEEYFRGNLKNTSRITSSIESVKNVKANFFNIASADEVDAPSLENYYRKMASDSSNVSEKLKLKFYEALTHLYFSKSKSRLDSAMVLFKELDDAGVENLYFKISLLKLYRKLKINTPAAELSKEILRKFPENPLAVFEAAETYKDIFEDLDRAKDLYRKTLDLFPQFCGSYIGLSEIEFMQRNYDKAVSLSDSALSMDPANLVSVKNAVRILKSTSSFEKAKKILDKLPRNSFEKYLEKARICLLQDDPGEALVHIDAALYEFPDKQELVRSYNRIEKIITLSDSIQRIENTVTRGRNNWTGSWDQAVDMSSKQKRPIIVAAVDSESLSSKYLELALLERSTLRLTKEAVMLKLFRHKDHKILDELGVDVFPTLMFVTPEKEVISSFENSVDMLTDSDAVISFLTEMIFLNKKLIAMNDDSERNRYKSAKDFSYAEELALEYSLPIIAILSSNQSYASDVFLKQTVFNPGFMSNYNNTVLLSIENAEESDLAKKYKIKKFPTVLIFDQDINLVSARYGIVPQKVLAEEINRVKLFRKMNEKIKENVNWLYDVNEALYFADKDQKPIFAYISDGGHDVYKPKEDIYSSYEVIKKINTKFIPLFLSEDTNKAFFNKLGPEFLPVAAVLDNNGNMIYSSYMPDKPTLNELLDYRMNANMAVSFGSEQFKKIQNSNRMLRTILDGGLITSAYNGLLSALTKNPGSIGIYNCLGRLFISLNDFSSAVYYLKAPKNRDFLVTDEYLKLLVTASILWDDFFRLDEFLNYLLKKYKNDKLAGSSVFS